MDTSPYISFHPSEIMPAPRPRAAAFGGRARVYHPKKYTDYQKELTRTIKELAPEGTHFDRGVPVSLNVTMFIPRPPTSKLIMPRGDIDNYAKPIIDALTKAGVLDDDTQVVDLAAQKYFTDDAPEIRLYLRKLVFVNYWGHLQSNLNALLGGPDDNS